MQLKIQRIKVNHVNKCWEVAVSTNEGWDEERLESWKNKLLQDFPGLENVIVFPTFEKIALEELAGPYWNTLVALAVPSSFPGIRTALFQADRNWEDQTISIKIDGARAAWLKGKDTLMALRSAAQKHFSLEAVFLLQEISAEDLEQYCQAREEEDRQRLEALIPVSSPSSDKPVNNPVATPEIYGKPISANILVTPIKDITDEEQSVTILGRVFGLDVRELKSGRKLITVNITDETDSLAVKIFEGEKDDLLSDGRLKIGACIKARGPVQYDKFVQELTMTARDITIDKWSIRPDEAEKKRVELHAHTKFSSMDGFVTAEEIIARAAYWGHKAIAITDHGVVQAFPEAYKAGKKNKIKIIYGLEGYLMESWPVPAGQKASSNHIIILVKNATGLKNLYRLVTESHLNTFLRRPRIVRGTLEKFRDGLILGSACEAGELYQAILNDEAEEKIEAIAQFYDFLEIQPQGNNEFLAKQGKTTYEELKKINSRIVALGASLGRPVVATGDVHFLEPQDEAYRRILMAGKGFSDADQQAPLYFRTTEEMMAEFSYLGSETAWKVVVEAPNHIADLIDADIKPIPEEFFPPIIDGADEQIREMTMCRAYELYGSPLPDIVEKRLDKELNSIISNGFAVLYLIAQKLVKKSNDDGYLVGSRGSVGSSFVATMAGITEVNPLPAHYRCTSCNHSQFITDGSVSCGADLPDKACSNCGKPYVKDGHDIPFETFLGFEGDKVPDIDLNFSGEYQPRAHKYCEELFGRDYVFRAGTISTIAERTAYGFVKNYFDERKIVKRDAEINRMVIGCSGVKRTTGQHPGGLMVVPKNQEIHNFTPLQRPADDVKSDIITTHFDYHSIHDCLVKLDILGHDDPTVIRMLEDLTGVDPLSIPLDDPKTISLFSSTEALGVTAEQIRSNVGTYGIPEFGTKFVRQMLEDTMPKSFSDLVRISGFSHGTDVWLNNAQSLIRNKTCSVSEAISTRDDIMTYLIYQGLPPKKAFSIMESVRKGKGLKSEDESLMQEHQIPNWYIESCKKIKYMFPKAHAVAYVTMAFRIAWFKVYYPEAFYATYFTVRADEFDADLVVKGIDHVAAFITEIENKGNDTSQKEKNLATILELALEMYQRGIHMKRVSLDSSHAFKFIIEPDGLLPPLASLQGVGKTAAENIVRAREEAPFTSAEDLRNRSRVSKTVTEALGGHGALCGLAETDQICLF